MKVVTTCRDVRHVRASEIMSKSPKTADPDMDLVNTANLMIRNKIKRLLITEEGKLVGIVTFTDLLRVYLYVVKGFEFDVTKLPKKYRKWPKR